jgi:hypothetical protein
MQKVSENETMNEQCHGQIEILHGRLIRSVSWSCFRQLELFRSFRDRTVGAYHCLERRGWAF